MRPIIIDADTGSELWHAARTGSPIPRHPTARHP